MRPLTYAATDLRSVLCSFPRGSDIEVSAPALREVVPHDYPGDPLLRELGHRRGLRPGREDGHEEVDLHPGEVPGLGGQLVSEVDA